jgi:hypothetical protein
MSPVSVKSSLKSDEPTKNNKLITKSNKYKNIQPVIDVVQNQDLPSENESNNVPISDPIDQSTIKSPKEKKTKEPRSKTTKRPVQELSEDYINQHTINLDYILVQHATEIFIGDYVKYINRENKFINGVVKDKIYDKENDTYRFKIAATTMGGFTWPLVFNTIQRCWRRPVVHGGVERTINNLVKFLDMKFDGEFSDFCQDPDRYISIVNKINKKKI